MSRGVVHARAVVMYLDVRKRARFRIAARRAQREIVVSDLLSPGSYADQARLRIERIGRIRDQIHHDLPELVHIDVDAGQ